MEPCGANAIDAEPQAFLGVPRQAREAEQDHDSDARRDRRAFEVLHPASRRICYCRCCHVEPGQPADTTYDKVRIRMSMSHPPRRPSVKRRTAGATPNEIMSASESRSRPKRIAAGGSNRRRIRRGHRTRVRAATARTRSTTAAGCPQQGSAGIERWQSCRRQRWRWSRRQPAYTNAASTGGDDVGSCAIG